MDRLNYLPCSLPWGEKCVFKMVMGIGRKCSLNGASFPTWWCLLWQEAEILNPERAVPREDQIPKKGKCVMDTERKYFPVVQNRIKPPLPFELAHINYIHVDQPTQPWGLHRAKPPPSRLMRKGSLPTATWLSPGNEFLASEWILIGLSSVGFRPTTSFIRSRAMLLKYWFYSLAALPTRL